MAHPEDLSVNRPGMQNNCGNPPLGGLEILERTGLLSDWGLRPFLTSHDRFEAYLEFRDESVKTAASLLVSRYNSPVDLFHLTDLNEKLIQSPRHFFGHKALHECYLHALSMENASDGSGGHKITTSDSVHGHLIQRYLNALNWALRYYAYRKYLVMVDFIQSSSDPEEVLKRIKGLNKCFGLGDHKLRHGLERHMQLIKEYQMSKVDLTSTTSCIPESFEKAALEKIYWEQSSELEECLHGYDSVLMDQYCNRTNYMHIARECAAQAKNAGTVLVEKALPIREGNLFTVSTSPTSAVLAVMKQKVKHSIEGFMGSVSRSSERFARGVHGKAAAAVTAALMVASAATGYKRHLNA